MKKSILIDFVSLAAIWGASFLFTRVGAAEFGVLPTAGMRVAIATAFLLPLLVARGQLRALQAHWKKIFFLGMLNSGMPFALYAFALQSISTGLSTTATPPRRQTAAQWR